MTYNSFADMHLAVAAEGEQVTAIIDNDNVVFMTAAQEMVYEQHPTLLLEEMLTTLGIPWEGV